MTNLEYCKHKRRWKIWDAEGTLLHAEKVGKRSQGYDVYVTETVRSNERGISGEYVGNWDTLREAATELATVTIYVG